MRQSTSEEAPALEILQQFLLDSLERARLSLIRQNESIIKTNETIERTNRTLLESNEKILQFLEGKKSNPSLKPPMVIRMSYDELVEIAFDPETSDRDASRAKNALIRARKKGGDINRFVFITPLMPDKGRITFEAKV